ncbi:MAG: PKD domain-containing protein, partial [Planctomycetota bacterium]|jgi:PKD repeat protein
VTATHTYENEGEYTAELTVEDDENNVGKRSVLITVTAPEGDNDPPVADFRIANLTDGTATVGQTVDFESRSSDPDGDDLTYLWDFGDGETDTGPQVAHAYTKAATYTVRLSVTDTGDLSDSAEKEVVVLSRSNISPVARIATPPGMVASGEVELSTPDDVVFDANLSSDDNGDVLTFNWTVRQDGQPVAFESELTGARVLLRLRKDQASCAAAGDPCLTPGIYSIVVTAHDGFEGGADTSDPWTITVRAGTGSTGGLPDTDPSGPGEPRPLTGNSSVRPRTLCGLGIQLPMAFAALLMAAMMVTRRRRW